MKKNVKKEKKENKRVLSPAEKIQTRNLSACEIKRKEKISTCMK